MQKKLTITVHEDVYVALHRVVGRGRISRFLEDLARPHVLRPDLEAAYREMAQDRQREIDANEWSEGLLNDDSEDATA